MNEDEIALRSQAIQLLLNGESKSRIARQLGKSRLWVIRWAARYQPDDPEGSLQDRDCAPKQPHRGWPEQVRQMAIQSRKARQEGQQPGYKYALISAAAIHYELRQLGINPTPPVRTIHAWLKEAGLVGKDKAIGHEKKPAKPYPAPSSRTSNDLHELDLKGPFYLSGSPQKYYLAVLRDAYSKRVALAVLESMQMEPIIDFLLVAWGKLGLPKVLQMDNGLEFRGSNLYPRSPSKLARVCLDLGVEPLFIPPREPWRNGVVENLNGLLDRLFLEKERFVDFAHLKTCAAEVEMAINTTHRLPALEGKTPSEAANTSTFRMMPEHYDWRKRNLQLVKGKISFIRLVRKSGRITLTASDKFEIGTELQWQYVLATIDIEAHRLDIFFQGELIKSFEYC
jgi:putative transposase